MQKSGGRAAAGFSGDAVRGCRGMFTEGGLGEEEEEKKKRVCLSPTVIRWRLEG